MANQQSHSQAVQLLINLIKCASVSPHEDGVLDLVSDFLSAAGFAVTRLDFEGDGSYPVGNLFATFGSGGKHVLFGGHTDVVPVGDEAAWTHPPFAAEIADDILFGRGAVDMKSGVAAFCVAAANLAKSLPEGAGRISLAITNDEEADAINGTDKILQWAKSQGHQFDFAIVGEPSSMEQFGDSIKVGRRGSFTSRISVTGTQGHAAYPERANNPVPIIAKIADMLSEFEFDTGSEHFPPTNLEVTSIDVGNKATNVIPAKAELTFNVRFNDHWTGDTLATQIDELLAAVDANGGTISRSLIGRVAPSFVSPVSGDVQVVVDAIEAATGTAPQLGTFGGTSDARFIASYCPVVECGLVGKSMHEIDERVPLEDVDKLEALYTDILQRLLA